MPPFRALVRRAFPYFVIAVAGFAVAYVIVFVFVLPSRVVQPKHQPYTPDSSNVLRPVETPPAPDTFATPMMAPPVLPNAAQLPVAVPNLVGMALPDARGVLNGLRLTAVVRRDTSSSNPPGTVLRQIPEPEAQVSANGVVTLVVSEFPPERNDTARAVPRAPLPPIQAEPSNPTPSNPTPAPTPADTPRTPAEPPPAAQAPPAPTPPTDGGPGHPVPTDAGPGTPVPAPTPQQPDTSR